MRFSPSSESVLKRGKKKSIREHLAGSRATDSTDLRISNFGLFSKVSYGFKKKTKKNNGIKDRVTLSPSFNVKSVLYRACRLFVSVCLYAQRLEMTPEHRRFVSGTTRTRWCADENTPNEITHLLTHTLSLPLFQCRNDDSPRRNEGTAFPPSRRENRSTISLLRRDSP